MGHRANLPLCVALGLVGALLAWMTTIGLGAYRQSVLEFVGINIILAVSLNLTNGLTGLFSLGHPGFMALGGYTAAILTLPSASKHFLLPDLPAWLAGQQWPFAAALLAGGAIAGLSALALGLPVLRLRGHYLAVATLGFIIIVQSLVTNLDSITRGALGLSGLPPLTQPLWVYGWIVVTLVVAWRIKHSSLGRSMLAIRDNELAARSLGVAVTATRLLAFATGAFFAGVAGGLWVHLVTIVTPHSFGVVLAFNLVVMLVVGGSGSITGATLAAVVLTGATEGFRPLEERLGLYGLSQMLVAAAVLLVLLFRPQGLFGSSEWSPLLRPVPIDGKDDATTRAQNRRKNA